MEESDAQAWLADHGWWDGPAGDRLRGFVDLLLAESERQNLISAGSRTQLWARHIVDSAQLLTLARDGRSSGLWADLGTGAGLPGLVIACLREAPLVMIEVRPLRAAFLRHCVEALNLRHATVVCDKVERVRLDRPAAVISARAYAPMDRLLASAVHLADLSTVWLLPKGRNAEKELAIARRDWQAVFHVEQSVTDSGSAIVTLDKLTRRAPGRPAGAATRPTRKPRAAGRERRP